MGLGLRRQTSAKHGPLQQQLHCHSCWAMVRDEERSERIGLEKGRRAGQALPSKRHSGTAGRVQAKPTRPAWPTQASHRSISRDLWNPSILLLASLRAAEYSELWRGSGGATRCGNDTMDASKHSGGPPASFLPHDWRIMLPLSQRVQPVYTLMALSRYRNAPVRHAPPAEPRVYPPLVCEILTPRPFRTEKPLTQDAFHLVSLFLQKRCAYPELCESHNGPGAPLLTPRLDAQTSFAKLFADIGTQEDVRRADLATLLVQAHLH